MLILTGEASLRPAHPFASTIDAADHAGAVVGGASVVGPFEVGDFLLNSLALVCVSFLPQLYAHLNR